MEHYSVGTISSRDQLSLNVHYWGDPEASPVILLHGGGQTGWAWESTARRLAHTGYYCIAPDLRGHGASDWASEGAYEVDDFAADIACVAERCAATPVAVGASLGGMSALLAEAETGLFTALALVDITPSWEQRGVERILSFLLAYPDGFANLQEAAAAVGDYLPHRERAIRFDGLKKNLRRRDDGRWVWRWDPNMLERAREMAGELQSRLSRAAAGLELPTLLISGGLSDVVSDRTAAEFLDLVPHAEHIRIDDAHHMVAGDANDAFTDAILDFLTGFGSGGRPEEMKIA